MNKNKYLLLFPSLVMALSISACSNEQQENQQESVVEAEVLESEAEVAASNKDKSVAKDGFSASSINMADYKVVDLSSMENLDWLTPFLLANTSQEITDEDKVRLFSDEYNSETDGFKKKDMFNELLPKVKQEIKSYENANIIVKAPIFGSRSSYEDQSGYAEYSNKQTEKGYLSIYAQVGSLGPYDFDNEGFRYECSIGLTYAANKNGIDMKGLDKLQGSHEKIHCETDGLIKGTHESKPTGEDFLKVSDEALARKIESIIDEDKNRGFYSMLGDRGDAYFVLRVIRNNIYAIPLKADVEYFSASTKETLLKKQLKFTWDGGM